MKQNRDYLILEPTINKLEFGLGYSVASIEFISDNGSYTESKVGWIRGRFRTKEAAVRAAVEAARQYIDRM